MSRLAFLSLAPLDGVGEMLLKEWLQGSLDVLERRFKAFLPVNLPNFRLDTGGFTTGQQEVVFRKPEKQFLS